MTQSIMKEIESLKLHLISIENMLKLYQVSNANLTMPEHANDDIHRLAGEVLNKEKHPTYSFFCGELIITRCDQSRGESELHISRREFMNAIDLIMEQMCSKGIYRPRNVRENDHMPAYRVQAVRRLLSDAKLLQKRVGSSKYMPVNKHSFRDKCSMLWDAMEHHS